MERASLARPTLSGVHDRALATADKLCSCSKSGVGELLEYRALSELHPVLGLAVLKGRKMF